MNPSTASIPTGAVDLSTLGRPARARVTRRGAAAREARFRDLQPAPRWMVVTGTMLALAGAILLGLVTAWPDNAPEVAFAVPGLVALVGGVLIASARSGMEVTADRDVVLRFRPLPPRRIARDRIVAARVVDADARTYGGIGLRLAHARRALVLTPGAGIELTDDRGRVTFVRTDRPDAALRALHPGR